MSSAPASSAKTKYDREKYPLARLTAFNPQDLPVSVLYAPNNGKQVYWRNVLIRWASLKNLSLNEIYRRVHWDEAKQWRRRQNPELRLREAALLALACEAPLGPFLEDLVLQMGFSALGQKHLSALRQTHEKQFRHGTCTLCGSAKHKTAKCKRHVTARELLELLRADHLTVLGAHRRRRRALRREIGT